MLKQLPTDTPASVAMALEEYKNYDDLRENVSKQVQFLGDVKGSHNLRGHVVDSEASQDRGVEVGIDQGGGAE